MLVCLEATGCQHQVSFFNCSLPLFLRQGPSVTLKLFYLSRLASQWRSSSPCLLSCPQHCLHRHSCQAQLHMCVQSWLCLAGTLPSNTSPSQTSYPYCNMTRTLKACHLANPNTHSQMRDLINTFIQVVTMYLFHVFVPQELLNVLRHAFWNLQSSTQIALNVHAT